MKKETTLFDVVLAVVIAIGMFFFGLSLGLNAPQFKAHVKDGVTTIIQIK
jgi:hypothetical protein